MSRTDAPVIWIPVLLYHRVLPRPPRDDRYGLCTGTGDFEGQLRWLERRGFTSVPLSAVEEAIVAGDAGRLPPRPVAVTFDDGYRDVHRHAWPILARHRFHATVFLVADAIGRDNFFDAEAGVPRAEMLSRSEIREMHAGGVSFGSHSATHPTMLAGLSDARLEDELDRSRMVIEDVLGAPVVHFAYPRNRWDERVVAAVERAGYRLACAGWGSRPLRFCLPRIEVPAHGGLALEARMRWRQLKAVARHALDR